MKKRVIKTGILVGIFLVALVISSKIMNNGADDEVVDMGEPTLPRVSFFMNQQEVNTLFGYVDEMDITAMRDTITPLESNGFLSVKLDKEGNKISKAAYTVYSLDGEDTYTKGNIEDIAKDGTASLNLSSAIGESVQEAVLKITLTVGTDKDAKDVNYFTRIEKPDDITAEKCLSFAQDFHTKAINKTDSDQLRMYLEPGDESDNTTYQTVNIHSDITHIQWGTMEPELAGDVEWSIKESNSVYTSILAKYRVKCANDAGETGLYDIKEFFRVRVVGETIYLLDYNRDMQEVFSTERTVLDENGILLGVTSEDISYETNKKETILAFVQNRDLWLYNKKSNELIQVFSFANENGTDARSLNDQHAVRIISMDNNGNMAFAVYGYMNRGEHEGEVGVGVFYFNIDSNIIQEKAFIPSTKSYAIAADELGKMVYYNHAEEQLYVLADGTLYQVDLKKNKQEVLAENLKEGQYAVSDDGHLMAYQTTQGDDKKEVLQVMNLSSLENYTVEASSGDTIRPLGFVNGDFIYGKSKSDDAGTTASGEEITPMYELEIRNSKNKEVAKYSFTDENIYISDILIDSNLVTLNRMQKNGNLYNVTSQEYITNNKERTETTVSLETYTTDMMQKQMRFTFTEAVKETKASVIHPNQRVAKNALTIVLNGKNEDVKYYVYGVGELAGIYDKAAYAIQKADNISGVVISSDQSYVWEKGNRDLAYTIEGVSLTQESGETSLEACERYMKNYEATKIDMTGCTLDQVLYVINRGCPVVALTSADHAVLLTGYTKTDITYLDPETGEESTVSVSEMEKMVQGSGNTFIGYICADF